MGLLYYLLIITITVWLFKKNSSNINQLMHSKSTPFDLTADSILHLIPYLAARFKRGTRVQTPPCTILREGFSNKVLIKLSLACHIVAAIQPTIVFLSRADVRQVAGREMNLYLTQREFLYHMLWRSWAHSAVKQTLSKHWAVNCWN